MTPSGSGTGGTRDCAPRCGGCRWRRPSGHPAAASTQYGSRSTTSRTGSATSWSACTAAADRRIRRGRPRGGRPAISAVRSLRSTGSTAPCSTRSSGCPPERSRQAPGRGTRRPSCCSARRRTTRIIPARSSSREDSTASAVGPCEARADRLAAARPHATVRLRRHAYHQFTEVATLQQADERVGRALQPLDDVLSVFHATVANPRRDVAQETADPFGVVGHDEPAHGETLAEHRREVGPGLRDRVVVLRDETAHRHARKIVEERPDRALDRATDTLEVDVDAVRAGPRERLAELRRTVVDARVEAEHVDGVAALLVAAGDSDDATFLDLCDLADHGPGAPDAADTTTVSPARGRPMSRRPTYPVIPGMPSTPTAVEIGASVGSSLRSPRPGRTA